MDFGNKFHAVFDEFHERSEWNLRKQVKFIPKVHKRGVDLYIITWLHGYMAMRWRNQLSYSPDVDNNATMHHSPYSYLTSNFCFHCFHHSNFNAMVWREFPYMTSTLVNCIPLHWNNVMWRQNSVEFGNKFHWNTRFWLAYGTYPCNNVYKPMGLYNIGRSQVWKPGTKHCIFEYF